MVLCFKRCGLAVDSQEVVHSWDTVHRWLVVERRVLTKPVVAVNKELPRGLSLGGVLVELLHKPARAN